MSATVFAGVQSAIVSALSAAPALAGGRIYANRVRALAANANTAIVVRLDQSASNSDTIGVLDWTTDYIVECYARGATGADPAVAVDALLSDVWARLAALQPGALGVQSVTLNNVIDWQYDDAETPVVCAVIRLQVVHRTAKNNLSPWV